MAKAKPFNIPKREVCEAFNKVKANQGAVEVDGQTIAEFEADLSNNLYRLWNCMSSGLRRAKNRHRILLNRRPPILSFLAWDEI